jgi:hypothetical protein
MKKPIPVAQVWVLVGTGMGMAENTHGLPVHFTNGKAVSKVIGWGMILKMIRGK